MSFAIATCRYAYDIGNEESSQEVIRKSQSQDDYSAVIHPIPKRPHTTFLAGATGLEPAASCVTGRRSNLGEAGCTSVSINGLSLDQCCLLALKANALNSLIGRGLLQTQHKASTITLGLHTAEAGRN